MRPDTFDRIAQTFAERRTSRRTAMGMAASAGAALGLSVAGTPAGAQEQATPEATPTASSESAEDVMFVQGFGSGSLAAKGDSADGFTLALEQGLGYTVYFTDRPERKVGAVPTEAFVDGFSFAEDNPPNAALVMENERGEETVAVLELTAPVVDADAWSVTYEATVLEDFDKLEALLQDAPVDASEVAGDFGSAHLFIDSCSDQEIFCCAHCTPPEGGSCGCDGTDAIGSFGTKGFCWHFGDVCCHPCEDPDQDYWNDLCNNTYAECDGNCFADGSGCW